MSDAFHERERGFERKYELDQELRFRIKAHRDYLFGLWVAKRLGKAPASVDAYGLALVDWNVDHPADSQLLDKVRGDLTFDHLFIEDRILRKELRLAETRARRDVLGSES